MTTVAAAHRGSWYYGWNIVAVAVLSLIAANGVPYNCLSLFLHPWSAEFHVPISQILSAMVPMMIVMSLSAAVVGSIADKKPARGLLGLGLGALALFNFLGSMATAGWQIEVIYAFLLPIPLVLATSVVSNPLVSRWFVRRLGLAIGITTFGIGMGGVFLPPLIAWVMPIIGWRNIWRLSAAVIGLVILPIVLLVTRDRPTEREGLHYVSLGGAAPPAHAHGSGGGGLRTLDVIGRKNFWFVIAVFLPAGCVYLGALHNVTPIALSRGIDQANAAMLISALSLSTMASTLIMGLLSDRFGNVLPLVVLAFASAGGALLLGLGESFLALAAGAALIGVGGGVWTILPAAASREFGATNVGRVFGLFSLALPINALASSAIARGKEVTGSYAGVLSVLGALCLIGGVLVMFMRERPRAGGDPSIAHDLGTDGLAPVANAATPGR